MNKPAIFHRADSELCYLTDRGETVIVVKCARGDISDIVMIYDDRYDKNPKRETRRLSLKLAMSDELHDYFKVSFVCPYSRLGYYFRITDRQGECVYYYQDGISTEYSWGRSRLFQLPYVHPDDTPHVPDWLKESVCYQIFPDSFANGRRCISHSPKSVTDDNGIVMSTRDGGTIRGVTENLDYIAELGVNLIYLNPIFKANSYHKYDTVDYRKIDPCLGDEADLRELVAKCHELGIKVMLDIVFNQTGKDFFAFRDVLAKQEESEYKDWYELRGFPVVGGKEPNYETFAFYDVMPKLKTRTKAVEDYLVETGKYWLREFDIDGYRLDVANELSHSFWRIFRHEMEKLKPDIALVGEVWHEAQSWVARDQFHGVLNFRLLYSIWNYLGTGAIEAKAFADQLAHQTMMYRFDNCLGMMNFLENHDTARFCSIAGENGKRQKLAFAFLVCYVGMPLVFYGSERSIKGRDLEEGRHVMVWDESICPDMYSWYKQMIAIRRSEAALSHGDYVPGIADERSNIVSFSRVLGDDEITLVLHVGSSEGEYAVGCRKCRDLITGREFDCGESVSLSPDSVLILKKCK